MHATAPVRTLQSSGSLPLATWHIFARLRLAEGWKSMLSKYQRESCLHVSRANLHKQMYCESSCMFCLFVCVCGAWTSEHNLGHPFPMPWQCRLTRLFAIDTHDKHTRQYSVDARAFCWCTVMCTCTPWVCSIAMLDSLGGTKRNHLCVLLKTFFPLSDLEIWLNSRNKFAFRTCTEIDWSVRLIFLVSAGKTKNTSSFTHALLVGIESSRNNAWTVLSSEANIFQSESMYSSNIITVGQALLLMLLQPCSQPLYLNCKNKQSLGKTISKVHFARGWGPGYGPGNTLKQAKTTSIPAAPSTQSRIAAQTGTTQTLQSKIVRIGW